VFYNKVKGWQQTQRQSANVFKAVSRSGSRFFLFFSPIHHSRDMGVEGKNENKKAQKSLGGEKVKK
jgi:hypothetical protein